MTDNEKLALIADVLELTPEDITADTVLADLDEWNSLNILSLIVVVDENFGKTLTSATVKEFKTVGDIMAFMEKE